ncbi:hypothetical protein ACQPZA_23690 [Pseudonocardia xinjiangensis]|uniref:hypothetical protein n=1 Tax=Pseudonocardia xinjiangensis TaxID=75289 RepID=UPI003D92C25A
MRDALAAALSQLPEPMRLTLTCDQGSELAYHHQIAPLLRDGCLLRSPGKPVAARQQREQPAAPYVPKPTDLSIHTLSDLRAVEPPQPPTPQVPRLAHSRRRLHGSNAIMITQSAMIV